MPGGGQTTVVQRILERRASPAVLSHEETTATIAVMLRVVPPPKALLVFHENALRQEFTRRISADMLECEALGDPREGLQRLAAEPRAVIITDSLELIRKTRARRGERQPFILYVAPLDEAAERESGLAAGADDCVARRAAARELDARVANARRVAELEAVLRITLAENRRLSATDDLTRLASRRFFTKHFPREVERAARYRRPLSLILCDIDLFKGINDSLGHAGGDTVLREFGQRLQQTLRRGVDWVARIGGEEFAIVLPETGYAPALDVARKLRAAIAQAPFRNEQRSIAVTASFGMCGLDRVPSGERRLAQEVLKIADAALYRSKHSGRNRVTATQFGEGAS
jgi:two-component system, cell cycle response regulator